MVKSSKRLKKSISPKKPITLVLAASGSYYPLAGEHLTILDTLVRTGSNPSNILFNPYLQANVCLSPWKCYWIAKRWTSLLFFLAKRWTPLFFSIFITLIGRLKLLLLNSCNLRLSRWKIRISAAITQITNLHMRVWTFHVVAEQKLSSFCVFHAAACPH